MSEDKHKAPERVWITWDDAYPWPVPVEGGIEYARVVDGVAVDTHLGILPLSLIDEIYERRRTIYTGFDYRLNPEIVASLKTDLDYLMAFVSALRAVCAVTAPIAAPMCGYCKSEFFAPATTLPHNEGLWHRSLGEHGGGYYKCTAAPILHCSCGAACTSEEYETHRAMGHDAGTLKGYALSLIDEIRKCPNGMCEHCQVILFDELESFLKTCEIQLPAKDQKSTPTGLRSPR